MNSAKRLAATQAHQQAIATINEVFDRLDELAAARDRLTGIAPRQPDDDPIQDAELLLDHARRLGAALKALRSAALAAVDHRTRTELAADIGTKAAALFPRTARPNEPRTVPGFRPTRILPGEPDVAAAPAAERG